MAQVRFTRYTGGALASHTVTFPAAAVAGNTLIALVTSAGVIGTPAGYTKIGGATNSLDIAAYRKTAAGGETNVVFTVSAAAVLVATVYEHDDIGATGTFTSTTASYDSGSFQLADLTASVDSYLFAVFGITTNTPAFGTTWSAPMSPGATSSATTAGGNSITHTAARGLVSTSGTVGATVTPGVSIGGTEKATIGFLVARTAGAALSVNVGADQAKYTGAVATVTAVTTGGTGTQAFAWTKVNGPAGTFTNASSSTATFTPSAAGTYTLRCIVTDASGTAQDDLVLTVTDAPLLSPYETIASSTGWTATGGTVLAVLGDTSDATLVTSSNNPVNVLLDGTFPGSAGPGTGQPFTVRIRARKVTASTGTVTGRMYTSTTLRSTVTVNLPDTLGDVDIVFPATDLTAMTPALWAGGIRVTLSATAA